VKVLTHRLKSYFLESVAQLPDTGTSETETVEKVEGVLPATAVNAPNPIYLEMPNQPKVQELSKAQELPKALAQPQITTAPAGTPKRGRRMANVLEVVLRPLKMVSPAPPKIFKDEAAEVMVVTLSTSADSVKAGPSEATLSRENLRAYQKE
jgi:hypothetical protein